MAAETTEVIRDEILDTEEMKKLYVRGIPKDTTDEELKEFFETNSGGTVTEVAAIRKDGEQKFFFGFITFEESELIDKLLLKRDDLKFKDHTLNMNRAVPKNNNAPGAHERTKKLFIANVPRTGLSEEEIMKYLKARHTTEEYGTIESVELVKKKDDEGNKTEENKGFGFVMVSSEDMADKMCIQHATFELGGRKIEMKKSSPPGGEGGRGGRGRGGRGGRGGGKMTGGYGGGYGGYGGGYDAGYGAYGGYGGGYGGYGQYGAAYGGGYGGGYGQGRFAPY